MPYDLVSALQKDIRRGNEYEALFWAVKLESLNPTRLWNRLKVIASEDIGPANPIIPLVI
jgi:replication-associated recombination protein RarA